MIARFQGYVSGSMPRFAPALLAGLLVACAATPTVRPEAPRVAKSVETMPPAPAVPAEPARAVPPKPEAKPATSAVPGMQPASSAPPAPELPPSVGTKPRAMPQSPPKPLPAAKPEPSSKPEPSPKPEPFPKPEFMEVGKAEALSPQPGGVAPAKLPAESMPSAPPAGDSATDRPAPAALVLSAEDLPLTIDGWVLEREGEACVLKAPSQKLFDGYGDAHVRLSVTAQGFQVSSDSQLDPSYPKLGFQFDGEALRPWPSVKAGATTIAVSGDFSRDWRERQQLSLYLGFWPTWPMTETRQVNYALAPMARAMEALTACQKL